MNKAFHHQFLLFPTSNYVMMLTLFIKLIKYFITESIAAGH